MPQKLKHTEPSLNSQAAAYMYEPNSSSAGRAWYARSSKTGYTYRAYRQAGFGARYYSSDLSLWLSVDPLASKYPSMSPYMYVRGNPVMLIDKWGLEGDPPDEVYHCYSCDKNKKPSEDFSFFKRGTTNNTQSQNNYTPMPAQDFMRAANRQRFLATSPFLNSSSTTYNQNYTSSDNNASSEDGGDGSIKSNNETSIGGSTDIGLGEGISATFGSSFANLGCQISVGFFGSPGSWGQGFISIGLPPKEVGNIDLSFSVQYLMGYSSVGSFDLSGGGKATGIGALVYGASYMTDNNKSPSYRIIGLGPTIGAKFTSSSVNTQTFTFPVFLPFMGGGRAGSFFLF